MDYILLQRVKWNCGREATGMEGAGLRKRRRDEKGERVRDSA